MVELITQNPLSAEARLSARLHIEHTRAFHTTSHRSFITVLTTGDLDMADRAMSP